jgi:hypothetical protein
LPWGRLWHWPQIIDERSADSLLGLTMVAGMSISLALSCTEPGP